MILKALSTVLLILIVSGLTSCEGDDAPASESLDTQIDAPVVGGGLGPRYEEPIPITTGDYWSSDLDFADAVERVNAAERNQGPPFNGELAGIKIIPLAEAKVSDRSSSCKIADFVEGVHFEFTYLPPGTYAIGPQFAALCADGRPRSFGQEFSTKHGGFSVSFGASDRVLFYDLPAERVHATTVNGTEALALEPPIPEGLGSSFVAQATHNGYLRVHGAEIPLSELVAVLEGLKCEEC